MMTKNRYSPYDPAVLFDHHVSMMSFRTEHIVGICTMSKKGEKNLIAGARAEHVLPVVIREHARAGYVVVCVAVYIDKLEVTLHLCRHSFRVARELFPDVLFKSSPPPAPHFLNLSVGVSR